MTKKTSIKGRTNERRADRWSEGRKERKEGPVEGRR